MPVSFEWPTVDFALLHRQRWERVEALMREQRLDHLLLTGADHIRYVTDFRAQITNEPDWFVAVVSSDGTADLMVPYVDEVVAADFPDKPWIKHLRPLPSWSPPAAHPATWVRAVQSALDSGARRVGVDAIDTALLSGLRQAAPQLDIHSVSGALFGLRRFKLDAEIVLLEAASHVNTAAMEAAALAAVPGATDHDVLAAAMAYQQSAGVEFVTHSVCNLRNGSGDWFAAGREFVDGDPFFFDIGCYGVGGYASDAARTAFVGEPRKHHAEAYATLLECHELIQSAARPGARASELQRIAKKFLVGKGYFGTPYAVGHGVGLRLCELPSIYTTQHMDEDAVLVEGEVIAIEPELSYQRDGKTTVLKIEDNFVVTANGLRKLTVAPEVTAAKP